MNDMTSTAVGHAVHATAKRKPMSASAETNMHTVGRRQTRQKKKYELYTSLARRCVYPISIALWFHGHQHGLLGTSGRSRRCT